eukprot:jgi/Galph1/2954/GphlegSOOS_G1593.1
MVCFVGCHNGCRRFRQQKLKIVFLFSHNSHTLFKSTQRKCFLIGRTDKFVLRKKPAHFFPANTCLACSEYTVSNTFCFHENQQQPIVLPRLLDSIEQVSAEKWNKLLSADCCPFMEYEWLYGLEKCGCVSVKTGWIPRHLLLEEVHTKTILAALPLYIKTHSMGEFIFDYQWSHVANAMYIRYYPKLLSMVPFTPVTGRRILTISEEQRPTLLHEIAKTLKQLVNDLSISSVHLNFMADDEVAVFENAGFLHRKTLQYRFVNRHNGYAFSSFEEYLQSMKSKKRIKVKRERRRIYEEEQIQLKALVADEIPLEMFDQMYELYKCTVDSFMYGRLYLNRSFFHYLAERYRKYLCFIVAYDSKGELIAGTFNLVKNRRFFGRYWGSFRQVSGLHFETCYYKSIEYCIEHGLFSVEPGAGGGEFKFVRGFNPVIVHSLHYFANEQLARIIESLVEEEKGCVKQLCDELNQQSVLRNGDDFKEKMLVSNWDMNMTN